MEIEEKHNLLLSKIKSQFSSYVVDHYTCRDELTYVVKKDAVPGIFHTLKNDPELKFTFLADVIGVDLYPAEKPRFEVVYQLLSMSKHLRLRVKVRLEDGESISTVTKVWRSAGWLERECYDMFGIVFDGHPDPRRIYLPLDWEGFPLRKDYPLKGYKDEYNPNGVEKKK